MEKNIPSKSKQKYIDLHIHLDGAITVSIAKKLADLQEIRLPSKNSGKLKKLLTVPADCKNLNDFLKCFDLPCSLMQTYESLREAARLVAEDLKKSGTVYAEIRFAPQLHTLKKMTQEDAVKAVSEGLDRCDLHTNIILCCMRGNGNGEANLETVRLAKKYLTYDGGVVALDLAGAEALFPTSEYRELFALAAENNIPLTIHAGEADGAESVRLAVSYGAKRIGHGVRIFEDEEVMRLVKEKGIVLEMCPTSNRQTCAVTDMSCYPFTDYLNYGIPVTLNTDDPAIEGTTIEKEFGFIKKHFGLTDEQRKTVLLNSVNGAFTTDEVKEYLKKELGI